MRRERASRDAGVAEVARPPAHLEVVRAEVGDAKALDHPANLQIIHRTPRLLSRGDARPDRMQHEKIEIVRAEHAEGRGHRLRDVQGRWGGG